MFHALFMPLSARHMLSASLRLIAALLLVQPLLVSASSSILVFGDSLSAGYGLALDQAWPALLAQRLTAEKRDYRVINASISGETTAGGRARLTKVLTQVKPALVIFELGANDGLRGLPVPQMQDNLSAMVSDAKRMGAQVLLVGMRLPPNYGADYLRDYESAFRQVAAREKVALLPFLLEPLVGTPGYFQPDGLHPVAGAQPVLLDHVWKALRPLLR